MNMRFLSRLGRTRCPLLFVVVLLSATSAWAQGSKEDYERAASYADRTRNRVFRANVQPKWIGSSSRFWYRIEIGRDRFEFIFVDGDRGTRRPAFDHERLAAALGNATGKSVSAANLPFRDISFDDDVSAVRFSAFGKQWRFGRENHELTDTAQAGDASEKSTGVKTLETIHPSRQTGEETSVCFVNRTAEEVKLYWIDRSGDQRPYGKIAAGKQHDQHTYEGHIWLVTTADSRPLAVFEAKAEHGSAVIDGSKPPMARRQGEPAEEDCTNDSAADPHPKVFIRDHNVWLKEPNSGDEIALSTDGTEDDPYQSHVHWSPDHKKFVVLQVRKGEQRKILMIESSPKDQLQPKLHTMGYAKPGDRMPLPRPRLFDVESRCQVAVSEALFPNAWSLSDIRWSSDSSGFTFLYNQRGHQVLRIVRVDAKSGTARAIVDEQSPTFIDYAHKRFVRYLDNTNEIIWMSERDGWNHLYLYDAQKGEVKNQITRGSWVVRNVEQVDVDKRQIWFRAGGVHPGKDPYYVHFCRVNFDGSELTVLTQGDGTHKWSFSPDRRQFIDSWSRVDQPMVTEMRGTEDGRLICELERADWTELRATGWHPPQRFAAKGRDGETDIYGIIVRPTNFDPKRKYAVIEKIYAGPQGAFVPKSFSLLHDMYQMAELGFIVVQIDGMGTSHRSKAFHDVCAKNLGDAGFPDRIAWMKAAATEHPEMDLTRVGIYGGSAGGQNALRGLLMHGDFYKAGAADCGCHDNRMDKIWWNEAWMGWPIGPHYEEQSNVTQAHRLKGKLLLTVGELDRNVDPASTMQVIDALIKADKDFDMLVVPGAGHGAGERPYAKRRRADFFVRHLLQVEPRWDRADDNGH